MFDYYVSRYINNLYGDPNISLKEISIMSKEEHLYRYQQFYIYECTYKSKEPSYIEIFEY